MSPSKDERFKVKASTLAYVAVVVVLAVALLFTSPAAMPITALVAVVALLTVWFRAGIRSGRWMWMDPRTSLTQGEGTVWLSAVAMFVPAIFLLTFVGGIAHFSDFRVQTFGSGELPLRGERAVSHSDPEAQQRLKRALESANIPHRIFERDGQEFVAWARQHNDAVEEIQRTVDKAPPMPAGRNVSFENPEEQRRFTEWLTAQKIGYEEVDFHNRRVVVWGETSGDVMERFMQQRTADCVREEAKPAKKGKKGCGPK